MRKTLIIALGAAVALVSAAVAMAAVFTASGVSATTATFSTDKVDHMKSRSCTGGDGKAFTLTKGRYTGPLADFTNPGGPGNELDGPVSIDAHTTYSTTDGLGYVDGSFRVKDDDTRLNGKFWGTLRGDQLVGFISASSRGHHARVIGNLSATFNPATGFTNGAIGEGSSTGVLAVLAGPVCKPPKPKPAPHAKLTRVSGEVDAVGNGDVGSTITVKTKGPKFAICTRDATSPVTVGFVKGDKVEMKCELVGAVWTLRELKKHL